MSNPAIGPIEDIELAELDTAPSLEFKRIVAKFGTNLLTAGTNRLDLGAMASLVEQIAKLHERGAEVIVVSSGAVAAGRHKLGFAKKRRGLPFKQVLAAVGQSRLMDAYDQLFDWHGITVAQTLLTKADLANRLRYLNARNTLLSLMELGVIAIVNENDVVAVDEISDERFGDNDNLSAMVANLVDADLLVILSDVAGLYSADPRNDPSACLISTIDHVDDHIESLAGGSGSDRGTGGMITKIQAAKLATNSGVAVVIAAGDEHNVLLRLAEGERIGSFFQPVSSKVESRKRWILSGLSSRGCLIIDSGAVQALRSHGRSLLPAGITGVEGKFERGDTVIVMGPEGRHVASGISNYSSVEIEAIRGKRSDQIGEVLGYEFGEEVVHRNNLVVT